MLESEVAKLERQRFSFLKELYDRSDGSSQHGFPVRDIVQKLGLDEGVGEKILWYLKEEGLLEIRSKDPSVALTHQGVKEVEQALKQPEAGTTHFPPNVFIVGQMTHSQVSQGASVTTPTPRQMEEPNDVPGGTGGMFPRLKAWMIGVASFLGILVLVMTNLDQTLSAFETLCRNHFWCVSSSIDCPLDMKWEAYKKCKKRQEQSRR